MFGEQWKCYTNIPTDVLVTEDKRLAKKIRASEAKCKVWDVEGLRRELMEALHS